MSTKTVRWHPSVGNCDYDSVSNAIINETVLYPKAQQERSSFSTPVFDGAAVFSNHKRGSMASKPVVIKAAFKSKGEPDAPSPSKFVLKKATPKYKGKSRASSSPKSGAPIAVPKSKRPSGSSLPSNLVASATVYRVVSDAPSEADAPSERIRSSSSQRTQKSKRSVPPWVPDAPDPLGMMPNTPRPRRLPTPDLPPIDPWTFYPRPIKPYSDSAFPPSATQLRQDTKSEISSTC